MTLDPGLPIALLNAARAVDAVSDQTASTAASVRGLAVPEWKGSAASRHAADLSVLADKTSAALAACYVLRQALESAASVAAANLEAEAARMASESGNRSA